MYNEQGNDSKTIYVERIPPNVDIDTLRHVFQKYGPVQYVSLPKYKHNGTPKGFAFLEFETEKGANDALEGFISIKRRISSALDPGELQRWVQTYTAVWENLWCCRAERNNGLFEFPNS